MSSSALAAGIHHLRRKLAAQQHHEDSDEQLLHAFLSRRDDSAFAALMRRHGPMVLHVCRRVLGHEQDAEDAFQATFLVLARNAASLRNKTSLASFLHGIAYRTAMKAKQSAVRRRKYEGSLGALTQPRSPIDPADELSWREVRALLDEEIARLPEKYRSVFILCGLEELSRAEAGQRLGLKERTVLSRLAEARKRLAKRLTRRGVELTAVLAASLLVRQEALALSPLLISTTIKAAMDAGTALLVSAQAAALVKCVESAAILSKAKIVTAVLLVVSMAAGAVGWTASANGLLGTEAPSAVAVPYPPQAKSVEPPRQDKGDMVRLNGRVLGPDGKPIQGARLYFAQVQNSWPRNDAVVTLAQPAPTGSDGRFHLITKRPRQDKLVYLLAHAAGLGVDWIDLSHEKGRQEATLRLPKDVPIIGRIVNTEGRPVAGVSVSVAEIQAAADEKLDGYLAGWLRDFRSNNLTAEQKVLLAPLDGILGKATTDKDGRFTLRGAGSERIVHVAFSGAGVARSTPWIITRPGFDTKPYNAVLRKQENQFLLTLNRFLGLFPPSFTFIAETGRTIAGVVKDADSGKPLPGCRLATQTSYGHGIAVVSDAEGKYRIDGLAKRAHGHYLTIHPPKGTAYLGRNVDVADTVGFASIRLDIELAKGVLVTGRVLDRRTGEPVRCYVRSVPLPGNKFLGSKPGYDRRQAGEFMEADEDGRFRLAAIPGKALLVAHVVGDWPSGRYLNTCRRAVPDPDHKDIFKWSGDSWWIATAADGRLYLDSENAVKVIDIQGKGENRFEMFVDRGKTVQIAVQDADSKSLAGAWAAGLTDTHDIPHKLPEETATVYALNPHKSPRIPFLSEWMSVLDSDQPRTLAFYHAEKKLGGTATVRGEGKGPVVVKLAPLGKISGRLLDGDGNPLEGVEVSIDMQSRIGRELYRFAVLPAGKMVHTDKNGRFRIEGVVPGLKFWLGLHRQSTFFATEPRIGVKQIRPGESLALGDLRVKARRP